MTCFRCSGKLGGNKIWEIAYATIYDKCRGKTCPNCGKVRKVVKIEAIHTENFQFFSPCSKCKRINNYWVDKLCSTCFLERERKRGCVCFYDSDYNEEENHHTRTDYYCPLCDEPHSCREGLCKKCFEKQTGTYQRNPEDIIKEAGLDSDNFDKSKEKIRKWKSQEPQVLLKAILPTAIISLVIGLFLGWLFFRKKQKKRKIIKKR